jgi:hypothetical protein
VTNSFIKFTGSVYEMKFILCILLFYSYYPCSGSNVDDALSGSIIASIQYQIVDEQFFFDTQSEDDILVNRTDQGCQAFSQPIIHLLDKEHPFYFNKSTDPFLELDIPPPYLS